jgi:hypothetical protein
MGCIPEGACPRAALLRKLLEYRFGGILVDFIVAGDGCFLVSSGLAVYIVVTAMTKKNCPL